MTAKVSATATVPNGNHLKSLDLAITANRYDIPATGTFDVQLQPVGTGVREIRVDKSQFGSTNPQLVWDIPQGEQPVFYIVELIQNGMRYEIYRTTSPSLDLRPTRISANKEVLFLIHTYYGSIDPAHPLTSLKIEGSVPTLSRIFKGSELIATPKRESSYLPRRSAFDTVDAASGNQRKAVPRSKRQLGILGKTMGMP